MASFKLTALYYSPRNVALLSFFSLGGGYLMLKSRTLAVKQRAAGDYSVTVDRSGALPKTSHTRSIISIQRAPSATIMEFFLPAKILCANCGFADDPTGGGL